MTPKQFADRVSQSFRDVLSVLAISNDRFIRTTDPAHEQRAQIIWQKLAAAGHIYKSKYSGWCCTCHEVLFSEKIGHAQQSNSPDHNRPPVKLHDKTHFIKSVALNK